MSGSADVYVKLCLCGQVDVPVPRRGRGEVILRLLGEGRGLAGAPGGGCPPAVRAVRADLCAVLQAGRAAHLGRPVPTVAGAAAAIAPAPPHCAPLALRATARLELIPFICRVMVSAFFIILYHRLPCGRFPLSIRWL